MARLALMPGKSRARARVRARSPPPRASQQRRLVDGSLASLSVAAWCGPPQGRMRRLSCRAPLLSSLVDAYQRQATAIPAAQQSQDRKCWRHLWWVPARGARRRGCTSPGPLRVRCHLRLRRRFLLLQRRPHRPRWHHRRRRRRRRRRRWRVSSPSPQGNRAPLQPLGCGKTACRRKRWGPHRTPPASPLLPAAPPPLPRCCRGRRRRVVAAVSLCALLPCLTHPPPLRTNQCLQGPSVADGSAAAAAAAAARRRRKRRRQRLAPPILLLLLLLLLLAAAARHSHWCHRHRPGRSASGQHPRWHLPVW